MTEFKLDKDESKLMLLGMLYGFLNHESNLTKTDLKVFFNMYMNSDKYDSFEFEKYSDVKYLIGVDKHQFSKSIKKLVDNNWVVRNDNKFKLFGGIPF